MSKSPKIDPCPCGQAHIVAKYRAEDVERFGPEHALPFAIDAFRDCESMMDHVSQIPMNSGVRCEVAGTKVAYHQMWLERYEARHQKKEDDQ